MSVYSNFFDYVIPEPNSGCHLWLAATNAHGYGVVRVKGAARLAHRIAYEIQKGKPPSGVLRHSCDNPCCVNINHLIDGTQKDNVLDMDKKHRRVNAPLGGERHPNSKITWEQVQYIRTSSIPAPELAKKFMITREQVRNIQRWLQRKEG